MAVVAHTRHSGTPPPRQRAPLEVLLVRRHHQPQQQRRHLVRPRLGLVRHALRAAGAAARALLVAVAAVQLCRQVGDQVRLPALAKQRALDLAPVDVVVGVGGGRAAALPRGTAPLLCAATAAAAALARRAVALLQRLEEAEEPLQVRHVAVQRTRGRGRRLCRRRRARALLGRRRRPLRRRRRRRRRRRLLLLRRWRRRLPPRGRASRGGRLRLGLLAGGLLKRLVLAERVPVQLVLVVAVLADQPLQRELVRRQRAGGCRRRAGRGARGRRGRCRDRLLRVEGLHHGRCCCARLHHRRGLELRGRQPAPPRGLRDARAAARGLLRRAVRRGGGQRRGELLIALWQRAHLGDVAPRQQRRQQAGYLLFARRARAQVRRRIAPLLHGRRCRRGAAAARRRKLARRQARPRRSRSAGRWRAAGCRRRRDARIVRAAAAAAAGRAAADGRARAARTRGQRVERAAALGLAALLLLGRLWQGRARAQGSGQRVRAWGADGATGSKHVQQRSQCHCRSQPPPPAHCAWP